MPSNPSELHFHSKTGSCIHVTLDCMQARRERAREEYNNAITFSNRPLHNMEIFAVALLDKIHTWQGSLEIGLTTIDPSSYSDDLPANAASLPQTWILSGASVMHDNMVIMDDFGRDLNELSVGDVVGVMRSEDGFMHILVNGEDIGTAVGPIPSPVWAVVDLYGKCAQLQVIPGYVSSTDNVSMQPSSSIASQSMSRPEVSTSQLPSQPLSFHRICGSHIEFLSLTATYSVQRINPLQEFNNGVVMSSRPLMRGVGDRFEIRIDQVVEKWSGSVEIGITSHDPVRLKSLPSTMTNMRSGTIMLSGNSILVNGQGIGDQYSQFTLDDVVVGDRLGVELFADHTVHFYFNGTDLGTACAVDPHLNYWAVVDLYGRTSAATVLPHHTTGDGSHVAPGNMGSLLSREARLSSSSTSELSPLLFGSRCGANVRVFNGGKSCQRKHSEIFNNGVVLTQRPLYDNEEFCVRLDKLASRWSGSLEVGVTDTLLSSTDIPKTMTEFIDGHTFMLTSDGVLYNDICLRSNVLHSPFTWCQSPDMIPADDYPTVLSTGQYAQDWTYPAVSDCYAIRLECPSEESNNNKIHFYINQKWIGCVCGPIPSQLYGVVDLFGQACEATLLHPSPRVNLVNHRREARFHAAAESLNVYTNEVLAQESSISPVVPPSCKYFHYTCGLDVSLSDSKQTAYRAAPFGSSLYRGLVFSSSRLEVNQIFEVCLSGERPQPSIVRQSVDNEELSSNSIPCIQFGLTTSSPENCSGLGNLSYLSSSVWFIEGGTVWHGGIAVNLSYSSQLNTSLPCDTRIGISYNAAGEMHIFLNGKDLGVACSGVPSRCYAVLNIFSEGCSYVHIDDEEEDNLAPAAPPSVSITEASPIEQSSNSSTEECPLLRGKDALSLRRVNVTSSLRSNERLRYSSSFTRQFMEPLYHPREQDDEHSVNNALPISKVSSNGSGRTSFNENNEARRMCEDCNSDVVTASGAVDVHGRFDNWFWVSASHGPLHSVCYHYTQQSPDLIISSRVLNSDTYYEMLFDDCIYGPRRNDIIGGSPLPNFTTNMCRNMEMLPLSFGVASVDYAKVKHHFSSREPQMATTALSTIDWCCLISQGGHLLCLENGVPLTSYCQDGFIPGLLTSWPRRLRVGIIFNDVADRMLTIMINGCAFPTRCCIPQSMDVRLCFLTRSMSSPYGTCMFTRIMRNLSLRKGLPWRPPDSLTNKDGCESTTPEAVLFVGRGVQISTVSRGVTEFSLSPDQSDPNSNSLVIFRRQMKYGVPMRIRIEDVSGDESSLSIGIIRLLSDTGSSRDLLSTLQCPDSILKIPDTVVFMKNWIFAGGLKAVTSSPIDVSRLQSGDVLSLVMLENQDVDDLSERDRRSSLYLCSSSGLYISIPLSQLHGTVSSWRAFVFLTEECPKISLLHDMEDKIYKDLWLDSPPGPLFPTKRECPFALKCDNFLRSALTPVKHAFIAMPPKGRQCFCRRCHDRRMLSTANRGLLKRLLCKPSLTCATRDPEKSGVTDCDVINSSLQSEEKSCGAGSVVASVPLGWCRYSLRELNEAMCDTSGWPTAFMSATFKEVIQILTSGADAADLHSVVPPSVPDVKSSSPATLQHFWCSNWLLQPSSSPDADTSQSTSPYSHSIHSVVPVSKDVPGREVVLSPTSVPTLDSRLRLDDPLGTLDLRGCFGLEVRVKPGSYKVVGLEHFTQKLSHDKVSSQPGFDDDSCNVDILKDCSCFTESCPSDNTSQSKFWITKERNAVLYTGLLIRVGEQSQ